MWKLVEVRNATVPSTQTRREQKAELFCQICYDEGRGYDLFTEGSSQKRVKFYGFNAHTFQKCYSYKQMGDAKRKKYDEEVERAIAGQLSSQLVGISGPQTRRPHFS